MPRTLIATRTDGGCEAIPNQGNVSAVVAKSELWQKRTHDRGELQLDKRDEEAVAMERR